MKYKVTCPQCKHHCYVNVSEPGDIKCKCPTCDAVFPVHISRVSFAEVARAQSSRHSSHYSLSRRQLNRRLAAFFIGSAAFICCVVVGLFACAYVIRHMNM